MINKHIDQTLLKANATIEEINQLIIETFENEFRGICIASFWVKYVSCQLDWINQYGLAMWIKNKPQWDFLRNDWLQTQMLPKQQVIKVISVIGFPLGNQSLKAKSDDAKQAIIDGAHEIDMVINIGMLLSKQKEYVLYEINALKEAIGLHTLKVIVETGFLTNEQLQEVTKIVASSKADYIKTCTGFGPRGVNENDVKIIRSAIKNKKIKVAGGIANAAIAQQYMDLGVDVIGTSNGTKIYHKKG